MSTRSLRRLMLVCALVCSNMPAIAGDGLRDPTRPPRPATRDQDIAAPRPLNLEAILQSSDRYIAIVDGKVVRSGDHIGNAIIEEITGDSVRYIRSGREHTIRLGRHSIKVRHESPDNVGTDHD